MEYTQRQTEDESWCMAAGMVSSGKSRFLNNIFPRLLLPVGTIPMTAAPTYIRYGKAGAKIITDEGQVTESRPGEIAVYDRRWARKESGLRRVEVYLEEDWLKGQLVFVDMPGIGGVEEEADRLFYQLLPQVQVVFYFLEKAMTQGDRNYLEEICRQGAKVILVRTKIDNIHSSEESVEEVLREEEHYIRGLYPQCEVYFISLDRDMKENQLDRLKEYVFGPLAEEARRVKQERQKGRQLEELDKKRMRLLEDLQRTEAGEIRLGALEKNRGRRRKELEDRLRWAEADVEKAADTARKYCVSQGQTMGQALADLNRWYQGYVRNLMRTYLPGREAGNLEEDLFACYEVSDTRASPWTGQEGQYERLAAEYFQRAKTDLLRHFRRAQRDIQDQFCKVMDEENDLIREILQMDRRITGERLREELAGTQKRLEAMRDEAHG